VVGAVNAILATLAVRGLRDRPELWQRRSVLQAAVTWALVSPAAERHRLVVVIAAMLTTLIRMRRAPGRAVAAGEPPAETVIMRSPERPEQS
jgi:hypothetical protein